MDLSDPTRAVTATLDGPVLAVLAAAGRPLTVGQVAQQAARGSEIGIRRSLERLVRQGIVRATAMGRNQVHELNREHVAAEVAIALAGLRTELWARFRKELGSWRIKPLYAAVFGSAARGDGDEASDIDLLLVHPPFPGERALSRMSKSAMTQLTDAAAHVALGTTDSDPVKRWEGQVERLRGRVESWTGNPLQVIDMSFFEWRHPPKGHADLISEVREDGIELVSAPALGVWPSREIKRG